MSPVAQSALLLLVAITAGLSADSKGTASGSQLKFVLPSRTPLHDISPDGRTVSFALAGNLVVRDIASMQLRQLTRSNPTESMQNSVFSPDARQVAYGWLCTDQVQELRVIRSDATGQRTVARFEGAKSISVADWSRDGRHLLIGLQAKDNAWQIALVRVEDGSTRVWKEWKQGHPPDANMHLSPDGQYVAHKRSATEIHVLSADGTVSFRQGCVSGRFHSKRAGLR